MSAASDHLSERVRAYLPTGPDHTIVDLGCGRGGHLIAHAAAHEGQGGRFVGLDSSAEAIAAARAAHRDSRVEFAAHDIETRLPFDDGECDAVLSVNTLEAIRDKGALLTEIHRILKPGGTFVCAHFDWDTQLFDGTDKATIRTIVHAYADWTQPWMATSDAWMGRRLWRTIGETRLFDGVVEPLVLTNTRFVAGEYGFEQVQGFRELGRQGMVRSDLIEGFIADLETLDRAGTYFYAITMFAFVGTCRA
ncbi:MAG: methyltransferase domain-containing protein [Erythrobacter sp.]